MAQQKESQISLEQAREDLHSAKKRLTGQAENLSWKEYVAEHPYIALGAAFFSGALLGGSREAREGVAQALVGFFTNEVLHLGKKE
jgi:hypothetical protein